VSRFFLNTYSVGCDKETGDKMWIHGTKRGDYGSVVSRKVFQIWKVNKVAKQTATTLCPLPWQCCPSAPSWYPGGQLQVNEPGVLWQSCWQPPLLAAHSLMSVTDHISTATLMISYARIYNACLK